MTIGERIKHFREKLNITQEDLAVTLGTTKQTIYKYENNIVTNIPSDKIVKMAATFEISPSVLMGWDEVEPPTTIAAHFDGEEYTEEELDKIKEFAEFVKNQRK